MQDFTDANAITIDTYQQIAPLYADVHKSTTRTPFWRQWLQRFAATLRSGVTIFFRGKHTLTRAQRNESLI